MWLSELRQPKVLFKVGTSTQLVVLEVEESAMDWGDLGTWGNSLNSAAGLPATMVIHKH